MFFTVMTFVDIAFPPNTTHFPMLGVSIGHCMEEPSAYCSSVYKANLCMHTDTKYDHTTTVY
jgi:hypothetical protein